MEKFFIDYLDINISKRSSVVANYKKCKNSKKSLSSKTIKMATMVCCEMHFLTTTSFISVSSTIADCVNRQISILMKISKLGSSLYNYTHLVT